MKKMKRSMVALLASASVVATSSFAQDPAPVAPVESAPAQVPEAAPVPEAPAPVQAPAAENEPPQINGIPGESILEGGTFSKINLDNFVTDDLDHPSQLRWKVSGNKNLKVTIGSDHTVEIATPGPLWNGSEDLTFTVTDSRGASASETVNFNVESVNNPPVVSQIPGQVVTEGKQFAKIRLDDYVNDPDNKKDQITWDTDIRPSGGPQADGDLSVTIDANRVATIVIPDAHWYGSATIKFIANDPDYGSDNKMAAFTVSAVNDPPVFTKKIPDQVIDEKNQFDMISLSDYVTDPDDDPMKLKWTVTGNKDIKIEIDSYGSAIATLPNENWNGQERVTFTVTDGAGASVKQDVLFKVNSINDPPEFVQNIPDQTIEEKQEFAPIQLGQYVKDPDHRVEVLKWTISGNKDLKVAVSGGVATIRIPNKMWNGSESIKFTACDLDKACAESEAVFTVNSVNDLPKFIRPIPGQNISERQQFTKIKLDDFVKDDDNKNSELSWDVEVKHQGPMPETGTLNVTIDDKHVATIEIPDPSWNGNTIATFTVTDPEGGSAKQDVALNVKSVNDPPVFKKIADQSVEEKYEFTSFNLDDYLSDADHDFSKLKVEVTGNRDLKVNIDNRTHEVSVKIPHDQWNGTETLMFTATDPEGARATTSAKFTVTAINDPPVMKDIREQTIKEQGEFKVVELDNYVEDPDHAKNRLKWTISGNRELKVQMDAGHNARITPPSAQWHGAESITFKVCDPDNACDERTVPFTVESVNDVPVFVRQVTPQTIKEKAQFQPIKLGDMVKDMDNKLSELTFATTCKPAGGKKRECELKVEIDDNKVAKIIVPNKFWNGAEEITFNVTDPEGAKASSTALFTVESVNDLPEIKQVADQTIQEKGEFTPFNVSELVSDPDDRFESLKIDFTGNKDLKVDMSKSGIVTVKTPNKMWNGTEKVTFTVTDPAGAKARSTATFTVVSVNDPPIMKEIASQTIKEKGEFKPIELDNFVEDLDHPKNRLKWKMEGHKELRVTMDAAHKVTVVPPSPSWNGSEKIRFTVTDPDGASDSKEVTFTVLSVNDAPEFVRDLRDQSIDEKKQFQPIKLEDFVKDADHKISELKWTFKVSPIGQGSSKKKGKKGKDEEESVGETLNVQVDANNVANIVIPNKYWHGAANITFTATDPEGASASKTARFEVRSVNDAPVLASNAPAGETILEGGRFKTIDLSTLADDPDHPASSLKWEVSGNRNLKVDMRKDNTVIITTPDPQWSGKETLTFSVTDPEGAYARHKMLFEVTRVNDPPVFVNRIPDQKIKEKETFKPIRLDEFVKDPDNKPNELRWKITGAKQLKAEISASRVLTVTAPGKDFWCAPEMMILEVSDPDGAKTSQSITFEVMSVNDPPVLKDIPPQKIREKGQFKDIELSKFVRDPDNTIEQLSWTVKVLKPESAHAKKGKKGKKGRDDDEDDDEPLKDPFSVVIYKGGLAHINIADPNWHGERNVQFTVKDPDGATDSKTVNFVVESVNDAPVIRPILAQVIKEKERFQPLDLTEYVSDPDHPAKSLKYEVAEPRALKASINAKKQLIVTTPDKYWNGTEKIRLEVTDPEGAKAVLQIDYEVTPVNDPPVISKNIPDQKIKEKEKFTMVDLTKIVNDPDNKPNELKWTVTGNNELVVDIKNGRASITAPSPDWYGKETLTFTVMDPAGDKQSTKATFEVVSVNDPPKFKAIPPQTVEEKKAFPPIDLSKYVTDPDNKIEEMKWSIDNENPFASAAPVKAKHSKKDKKSKKKKKGKKHVEEDDEAPAPVDAGKHQLKYNISSKGILTVEIPDKFWNGSETVTINVFDPSREKASVDVRFTVKSVNDPPVVKEIPGQTTLEGKSFKSINLDDFVSDPDHKNSEIRWKTSGAKNLDVRINASRVAEIKPKKENWFGEETVIFTATDPSGASDNSVVKFVVKHVNAPPVMRDIPNFTIKENQNDGVIATIKLDQYARDKDHNFDDLKWKFTGNKQLQVNYDKSKKTVIIAQPYSHWKGEPEKITFTVTDPEGGTAHKTATFTVIAVNNPPETKAQNYVAHENEKLKVPASGGLMAGAIDPDGDKIATVKLVMKPRNGRIILNELNGSFEYIPNKGFTGIDEFTYKVFDPAGAGSKVTNAEINVMMKMNDVRGNAAGKKKK